MGRLNSLLCATAAVAVFALSVVPGGGATAQPIDQFDSPGIYSTKSDLVLMRAIGQRLYRRDDAVKGASEAWQNPKSGHRGTITVLDIYQSGDMPCRKVRYYTDYDSATSRSYVLDWCRVQEGEWKIR